MRFAPSSRNHAECTVGERERHAGAVERLGGAAGEGDFERGATIAAAGLWLPAFLNGCDQLSDGGEHGAAGVRWQREVAFPARAAGVALVPGFRQPTLPWQESSRR